MSYFNSIKETENILALVEAIDSDKKKALKEAVEDIDNTTNDEFNIDDLDNTVDLDAPNEHPSVSFDESDIELSEEDKTIVRKNLENMLDELSGEEISAPALEMILQEVAQQSAYLSEAEENSVDTPVEKNELLKTKIKAIVKYAKELLDTAEENEGELPAEDEVKEEEKEESSEVPGEDEKTEEKEEEEEETLKESTEDGVVDAELENDDEGKEPVEEGVCTECGEESAGEIPEVGDEDVIKVVDDSEVEPIDLDLDVVPEEGEEEEKKEVDRLDNIEGLLHELISVVKKDHAVLESAGLFGEFTNKEVEGKSPVVAGSGLQKPDFQKKTQATLKTGNIKLAELRELAGKPRKVEPTTEEGRANKAEIEKNMPSFAKGRNDTSKSQKEPEGAWDGKTTTNTPKKPNGQKEVSDAVKARVVSESVDTKTKSFLQEARRIIREGNK